MADPFSTAASAVTIAQGAADLIKAGNDWLTQPANHAQSSGPNGFGFWPLYFTIQLNTASPEVYVWMLLIGYAPKKVRVRTARISRLTVNGSLTLDNIPLIADYDTIPGGAKQVCFRRLLYDSEARQLQAMRSAAPDTGQLEVLATGVQRRRFGIRESNYADSARHIVGWITRPV
jgi:hypothetical protein